MCSCTAVQIKVCVCRLGLLRPRLNPGPVWDNGAIEGGVCANVALYKRFLPLPFKPLLLMFQVLNECACCLKTAHEKRVCMSRNPTPARNSRLTLKRPWIFKNPTSPYTVFWRWEKGPPELWNFCKSESNVGIKVDGNRVRLLVVRAVVRWWVFTRSKPPPLEIMTKKLDHVCSQNVVDNLVKSTPKCTISEQKFNGKKKFPIPRPRAVPSATRLSAPILKSSLQMKFLATALLVFTYTCWVWLKCLLSIYELTTSVLRYIDRLWIKGLALSRNSWRKRP